MSESREKGPGPPMVNDAAARPSTAGYPKAALCGEEAVRGMDAGRDTHRGGSGGAGGRSGQSQGQGNPGSCFAHACEDGTGFCWTEAHGVHALGGAFDSSSAEPPEEFLGSVSDEHASEGDPEQQGLCGGGSLRAGR